MKIGVTHIKSKVCVTASICSIAMHARCKQNDCYTSDRCHGTSHITTRPAVSANDGHAVFPHLLPLTRQQQVTSVRSDGTSYKILKCSISWYICQHADEDTSALHQSNEQACSERHLVRKPAVTPHVTTQVSLVLFVMLFSHAALTFSMAEHLTTGTTRSFPTMPR